MKRHKKVLAVFVMSAALLPNLYVILKGEESYPFTQAPMFGHYVGDSTAFYDFRFLAEGPNGTAEVLPSHEEQQNALATQRFFFHSVYGSTETNSPFINFANDTPEQLSQRMSLFFNTYFKDEEAQGVDRIQLVVDRYNRRYELQESRTIGNYDLTTQRYTHTWNGEH